MRQKSLFEFISHLATINAPALTWYGPDRVELGGPVLARWLAKTENLLAEEFPFALDSYRFDLPLTWRAFPWYVACRFRGVEIASTETAPDLLITATLPAKEAEVTVMQPLESLALLWSGDLPPGFLDGAADLMGHSDALLNPRDEVLAYSETSGRQLLVASGNQPPVDIYAEVLAILLGGGTTVVVNSDDYPAAKIATIAQQEGIERA